MGPKGVEASLAPEAGSEVDFPKPSFLPILNWTSEGASFRSLRMNGCGRCARPLLRANVPDVFGWEG